MKPKGTIKESIENLHQLCLTQFEELSKKVDDVDQKCSALDAKVSGLVAKSGMGGMGGGMGGMGIGGNFVSIENKTDYLNHQFGSVALSSAPLLPFIQREIGVSETDVEMILKGSASIYDVVADRLVELVEKYADTQRFLYAFAFQKQVLYYWNQGGDRDPCGSWYGGDEGEGEGRGASEDEGRGASGGGTWEKMGNKEACAMFEVVQQKLIQIYTTMILDKHDGIRGVDVVEFGHRLFVDNFDTKSADFKKKLFLGLSG